MVEQTSLTNEETAARNIDALSDMAQQVSDIYAARFGITRDAAWYLAKLTEEAGELQAAWLKCNGRGRGDATRQSLEDEAADLLAMVLLFARWQGIDLPKAMARKWGQYLPQVGEA
jgi:NTP pyrophosphatase (non-canonical NTP hydrolase)